MKAALPWWPSVLACAAPLLALSCQTTRRADAPTSASPAIAIRSEGPHGAGKADWHFVVQAGAGASELTVQATFSPGSSEELSLEAGAEPFLRDLAVSQNGTWVPVPARGTSWFVSDCPTKGCTVRYRFLLADAVRSMDDAERGAGAEGAYFAPPATWLLHPMSAEDDGVATIDVRTPPGLVFVTGMAPVAGHAGSYVTSISDLPDAPYSAFGEFRTRTFEIPGGAVELAIAQGKLALPDDVLLAWATRSARGVAAYYGRFPVPRVLVMVSPSQRHGLFGMTTGSGGASILLQYGRDNDQHDLDTDWVLTHEMVHLAMPSVHRNHHWLEEGLATYVEPIARTLTGNVDDAHVWSELVHGLPNGLPREGDRGLDRTPTWGRTYWGGALFCTLADIEIRQRSQGKFGLGDALRGILAAGGSLRVEWPLEKVLATGDAATGQHVLTELYEAMARDPHPVDLAALWSKLGVVTHDGVISFDDQAPLASVRRDMTHKP